MEFHFPGVSDRTIVVGQTGSGKTWFGVWLLSHMPYDRMPWVVVDYKRETLFRELGKHAFRGQLTPSSPPPKKPGLYHLRAMEGDDEAIDDFFWRVWKRGWCGIYLDETTMAPAGRGSALRAILTQGRSLRIPIIACTQRPVDVDRFFFSESQYFALFFLLDRDDRVTVRRYTPFDADMIPEPYHCYWYDSKRRTTISLTPVPQSETFLERIRNRAPRRFWLDL